MKPISRPFADWVEGRVVPWFEEYWWAIRLAPAVVVAGSLVLKLVWGKNAVLYLLAPLAFVAGMWFVGWSDRRRARRIEELRENKICLTCGYDCRATPARCPECGRAPGQEG